jgi:predicted O-methyltransferase YrrM
MELHSIVDAVHVGLGKGFVNVQSLMARLPYVTPTVTNKAFYTDPRYYPTYFHLGRSLKPRSLLSMSLGGGLSTACFLLGDSEARDVLAYQRPIDGYYSPRMAKHNIRQAYKKTLDVFVGDALSQEFQNKLRADSWEAVIIDEECKYDDYLSLLRTVWPHISENGVIVLDRINYHKPAGRACKDFCNEINRNSAFIHSKYGVGLIGK